MNFLKRLLLAPFTATASSDARRQVTVIAVPHAQKKRAPGRTNGQESPTIELLEAWHLKEIDRLNRRRVAPK